MTEIRFSANLKKSFLKFNDNNKWGSKDGVDQPDDVLIINAAEHFEKGKRLNYLNPEHIEKIVDTYQHRKKEKRYSWRVEMEEIEENDYNLNISRYVSTVKPEPEIDLSATHKELSRSRRKFVNQRRSTTSF